MAEKKIKENLEKRNKREEKIKYYEGPFFTLNELGYENHPFYSNERTIQSELAEIAPQKE